MVATAAGAELLLDGGGGDAETAALVAASAAGGAARLRLLRAAFGPAVSPQSVAALRALAEAHLASQASAAPLEMRWNGLPATLEGPLARLLLNLVLLGRDALPRGGRVEIGLSAGAWPEMVLNGEPASLADDVRAALLSDEAAASPRAAQARFTRLLARLLDARIVVGTTARGLRVAVEPGTETPV